MVGLTKQEKLVLFILGIVLLAGSGLQYLLKKYPQLTDIVNLVETDKIYPKVDINKAGFQELVDLPYIGPYTAQKIIDYRTQNGPFKTLNQIKFVKGIKEKNFREFSAYLKI